MLNLDQRADAGQPVDLWQLVKLPHRGTYCPSVAVELAIRTDTGGVYSKLAFGAVYQRSLRHYDRWTATVGAEKKGGGLGERTLDLTAAPGAIALDQREQRAERTQQSRPIIGERQSERLWPVASGTEYHHAGRRLCAMLPARAIGPWACMTKRPDGYDYQVRQPVGDDRRIETQASELTGAKILDQDVGTLKQPPQHFTPCRLLKVYQNRPLAPRDLQPSL